MVDVLGTELALPDINITGFISSTWIYVLLVCIIGVIIIIAIALLLFYKTYNRKVIVFENISGQGYQPAIKTRARIIKVGNSGDEILKTLAGGYYLSAYGRKMGKNTYWYAKGSDGYLYNILIGDLDTKKAMLDIDPIDSDVRHFHVGISNLSHNTYDKKSFMEKYGVHLLMFAFLIVLIAGMWLIIGQIGKATTSLSTTAETNKEVLKALGGVLKGADNIQAKTNSNSGIVSAGGS